MKVIISELLLFLILALYVTDDYRYHERKTLSMSEFKKTQWHPPFCAAIKLELKANKEDLSFESEHNLNTKPIQIDLLVIKKLQDVNIQNEIGRIFKGHNIFEYKPPKILSELMSILRHWPMPASTRQITQRKTESSLLI